MNCTVLGNTRENTADSVPIRSYLVTDWAKDIFETLEEEGKDIGKQCYRKKKYDCIPSAENGDSPLTTFGFPVFNEAARSVVISSDTSLSYMSYVREPVKIGLRDYVIVGYPDELIAFAACFENYNVIGSSVNREGHWNENKGTIKIQLQNIDTGGTELNSTLFEMLFKFTIDRIIKYLNPLKVIKGFDAHILGGSGAVKNLARMTSAMNLIKPWIPGDKTLIEKMVEIYAKESPIKIKVNDFIQIFEENEAKVALQKQWSGWANVRKEGEILVTLTMYAKPENDVRCTYDVGNATITMKEVGKAIHIFLGKTGNATHPYLD